MTTSTSNTSKTIITTPTDIAPERPRARTRPGSRLNAHLVTRLDALENAVAWLHRGRAPRQRGSDPSPAGRVRSYGSIALYEELLAPLASSPTHSLR